MSLYSITAQCLTPLGPIRQIEHTTGLYQQMVNADSLQRAVYAVMETIAAPYKNSRDTVAVVNYDKMTVTILDERAHIVNFYWGFLGHKV